MTPTHTHHFLSTVFHGAMEHVHMLILIQSVWYVGHSACAWYIIGPSLFVTYGTVGLDCGTGPTELTERCTCLSGHFDSTALHHTTSCT